MTHLIRVAGQVRFPEIHMSMSLIATIAGVVALLYILPLLLAVLTLRFGWRPTVPTAAAVDVAWLDTRWTDRARASLEQLAELGFVFRTWLDGMAPKNAPTGIRCVAVLVNESTGDVAQVAVAERPTEHGGVELITVPIFGFRAGSKRVATSNSDTPGVFLRPREHMAHAFPMLHNVATLYRAHCAMCKRHVGTRRGELPAPGSEARQVNRETAEEFAYQAKRGLLKATPDGGYRNTWRGAFRGLWKLHPRFVGGQKRRLHARSLRLLGELGIAPDPEVHTEAADTTGAGDRLSPGMDAFIASACTEWDAAAKRLQAEWHLEQASAFEADLTVGVVKFHFADGHTVLGDVKVLGSWSRQAESWEWAWNNPNVASAVRLDGARLREFGAQNGIAYLEAGFVPAPNLEAAAYLAAVAAKVVGATAVIPIPPGGDAEVVAFATFSNVRVVQPNVA